MLVISEPSRQQKIRVKVKRLSQQNWKDHGVMIASTKGCCCPALAKAVVCIYAQYPHTVKKIHLYLVTTFDRCRLT